MKLFRSTLWLLFAGVVLSAPVLRAQGTPESLQIHGFGSWSYGRTNANHYSGGSPTGDYRSANFDLNVSARPADRLTILSQFAVDQSAKGIKLELGYAFAEWRFSDAVRLQAGKVMLPFGIYTEVFDVGTLRPFLTLPQSVYGPVGIVAEGFEGVAVRGHFKPAAGWNVAYNVYAGGVTLLEDERPLAAFRGITPQPDGVSLRDVLGARFVVKPPVPGLSFGASSFTGITLDEASQRESVVAGQLEYLTNRLWFRAEAARHLEATGPQATAWYVETAVFLTRQAQVAFLYDRLQGELRGTDVSAAPGLLLHSEAAFGFNYWPTAELGFKSSIHFVRGNRLAFPNDAQAADFLSPSLARATRLFQLGVQFSF